MFYDLPHEIISYIYEFDNTFRDKFDKVLEDIQQYQVYSYKNMNNETMFYIYDIHTEMSHVTNSLETPNWISTSFRISKKDMKEIATLRKLERTRKKLQYDISNFHFGPDYQNDFHELRFLD